MKRLSVIAALFASTVIAMGANRDLEMRAYLHDPVRPLTTFQFKATGDKLMPLELRSEGLSPTYKTTLTDDELVIHLANGEVAARAKVAAEIKQAAVLIVPAPANASPTYRLVVIDEAPATFPWGTSRLVSLLGVETALQAGEHKLPLPGGKITTLPEVKKLDEFNMAQTNFYYREGTAWVPFTERRLQYTGQMRRIFVVHATPGSQQPFVVTLIDYKPHEGT